MAAPTIPSEIWASTDYQLPVAQGPNKVRPMKDLWEKGWDKSEKPSAEEFNYILNMITHWLNYITDEQIPGLGALYLMKQNNLNDITDRAIARTNLDVFSKAEGDARYVNVIGDTMTGPLNVPRIDFPNGGSDQAYITTSVPSADWTYLDFVMGDNPGPPGTANIDTMRWRFLPSGGSMFSMMELNAISNTAAHLQLNGNLRATGSIQGSSLTATSGSFTNLTVNNTLTTNVVQATTVNTTNVNANDRVQANQLIANAHVTTPYLRTNGETNTNSLIVNNQWAVVGGRHVVRAVNGVGADGNGNLSLPMPPAGVQGIRLSNLQGFQERRGNERLAGGVMTTFADFGNSNYWVYLRYLQYLINGTWVTASYV